MKKTLLITTLLFFFSCSLGFNSDKASLVHEEDGIKLLQNKSKDLSIIDVDLNRAGVSFGIVNSGTGELKIDYEKSDSVKERFYRFYPKDLIVGNNNKVFAIVNGQFFNADKNPTFLSFPVKSNGRIISSYVDNDLAKRTLVIDKNENAKIIEGYNKDDLVKDNYKELIVAFSPNVEAVKDNKVGRSYIGVKTEKNIVFFVAKNRTQAEMNKIISDYGVAEKDIIMMDGGPSAQFGYFYKGLKSFYGEWEVPQYNLIYRKGIK